MTFRVGQKVVCVNAKLDTPYVWADDAVVEGAIYTITKQFVDYLGSPVVSLAEIQRSPVSIAVHGRQIGYCVHRFRPVVERKTDIAIFKRLLVPGSKVLDDA